MARSSSSLFFGVIVVAIIFGAFILVLWGIGLFEFSGDDASAKIVSASITLVGALIGSVVSVVGLFMRQSMDQRNNVLAREAEERLKLDTAIRAVGLFSTSSGNLAPMIQRVGALFALTSLNRHELAMALTLELLDKNQIDTFSAATILSRVMESGKISLQEKAVSAYCQNIDKFIVAGVGAEIPDHLLNWRNDLSEYSRVWGFEAVARLMSLQPLANWDIRQLYTPLGVLSLAWTLESDDKIKQSMGTVLNTVLPSFDDVNTLHHPLKVLDLRSIRKGVSSAPKTSYFYPELVEELDKWVSGEEQEAGGGLG